MTKNHFEFEKLDLKIHKGVPRPPREEDIIEKMEVGDTVFVPKGTPAEEDLHARVMEKLKNLRETKRWEFETRYGLTFSESGETLFGTVIWRIE